MAALYEGPWYLQMLVGVMSVVVLGFAAIGAMVMWIIWYHESDSNLAVKVRGRHERNRIESQQPW